MKLGQIIRHRVYARLRGHVALVNTFPDARQAAALVEQLARRYGKHGAAFWTSTAAPERDGPAWASLRAMLRQLEPPPVPLASHEPISATAPLAEEDIADYLANGGAITICRPHRANAPTGRRRPAPARRARQ